MISPFMLSVYNKKAIGFKFLSHEKKNVGFIIFPLILGTAAFLTFLQSCLKKM